MKILFIQHSCFWVETEQVVLIFDWFDATKIKEYAFNGTLPAFPLDKNIYVFASHKHRDHFDLSCLKWCENNDRIYYIFSKEIRLSDSYLLRNHISLEVKRRILFVKPHETYDYLDLQVRTLKSTDAGVAFYVKVNGASFYHAGDLNDWQMKDMLIDVDMKKAYEAEIELLKNEKITAAFVVCDPRLKTHTMDGILHFLENVETKALFPMHMWKNYEPIFALIHEYEVLNKEKKLKNEVIRNEVHTIMKITTENQEFFIS